MLSNPREKRLAGVLILTLAGVAGFVLLESTVIEPLQSAAARVSAEQQRQADLQTEFATVEHACKNLQSVAGQSLPDDLSVASVMYQEWLLQLCGDAGLESPVIIPGSPIAVEDVGHRLPFTVQATAPIRQIGGFLDRFQRNPLLHRLSHVSISSESRSSSRRRFTITIEALALAGTPVPDSLPRTAPRRVDEKPLSELFARADPFRRVVSRPVTHNIVAVAKAPSKQPARPEPTVRFVACVSRDGESQAWFSDDGRSGFTRKLGDTLTVDAHEFTITSLASDRIVLASDGQQKTILLGQTL